MTTKVNVICLLSSLPAMATWLEPFRSIVICPVGAYLEGVWSAFNIRTSGTLCSLTKAAILCRNWNRISSQGALGIDGVDVVLARLVHIRTFIYRIYK